MASFELDRQRVAGSDVAPLGAVEHLDVVEDIGSINPRSGIVRRHDLYDETFMRTVKRAVRDGGITSRPRPTP